MSSTLAKITKAKAALIAAKTLDDVLEIRDQAEAVRVYVKAAKEGQLAANAAAEIKLCAERKAGELLAAREKAKEPDMKKRATGARMAPAETLDCSWHQQKTIGSLATGSRSARRNVPAIHRREQRKGNGDNAGRATKARRQMSRCKQQWRE